MTVHSVPEARRPWRSRTITSRTFATSRSCCSSSSTSRTCSARRPTRTGARTKCSRSSKKLTAGSRSISGRSTRSATRSAASSNTVRSASGSPEHQDRYVGKMFDGTWAGTMGLTEPQAGSDVGSAATQAIKRPDGRYNIKGTKIFISGGDQDMSANIVHMVLARTPAAPPGTKGLSLFIVPKLTPAGTSNDVATTGIEHKMGIKASSTAQLAFGDNGNFIGELVGTVEQKGMSQMFHLMNFARIGVGLQGLSIASSAYLNALEYAKDRKQGSSI